MAQKFTVEPARGTIVVRTGDSIIAESRDALMLRETGHAPVYYLPRADVGMAFLDRSDKVTHCPHKGDATHYHVIGFSERIPDAAWSYDEPVAGAEAIAGRIAFYPDKLAVEGI